MSAISRVSPAYIYTVAIKDFMILTEYIARHKETCIEVPGSFVSSLNRAISTRISHGTTISRFLEKTEETRASDNCYSHFIEVLEHVREILHPLMPEGPETFEPEAKSTVGEKFTNLFGNLGLFQLCEGFINVPDATPPASGEPLFTARYQAERPQDDTEALFLF